VSAFEEDFVFVAAAFHIGDRLLIPVSCFLIDAAFGQFFVSEGESLCEMGVTLVARMASCRMIYISLSTFLISFLAVLITFYFRQDLVTKVLRDLLVEASSFSISLTWFCMDVGVRCSGGGLWNQEPGVGSVRLCRSG
jgi:hypothetical protein